LNTKTIKWLTPQKILVILAHPDDPEFFCGGTLAKWIIEGHEVSYCLLTKGEKGINENFYPDDVNLIKEIRFLEQKRAAAVLGVRQIRYLANPDGYLVPSLSIRRQVVREIRISKPDIVISCDPTNYFLRDTYINHPDHRAAGQIVVDSVFPAAQNQAFFPDLMISEKLDPHKVKEVWFSLASKPNISINVTNYWNKKIEALYEHKSQIGDKREFDKRMLSRRTKGSSVQKPKFEELFHRIVLQR
jgi:LmbE family N-acetylglucosaminyl deacetylase